MSTKSSNPKKYSFLKTLKNIEIQNLEPQKIDPSLRMYENIRVPPWGCRIIRLGTKTLINWLIYWLSIVVGWGLGRCRKVLNIVFIC